MASKQITPTRMELTRLKKKLVTATRGHKLLKDKRDELMRQFLEKVRENRALRERVEAGIMAAKRTHELIPMCHPLQLTAVDLSFTLEEEAVHIRSKVKCKGETGVEMEALTAVSAAALTIYDMCKAVQRDMEIADIRLCRKSGGKTGDYVKEW